MSLPATIRPDSSRVSAPVEAPSAPLLQTEVVGRRRVRIDGADHVAAQSNPERDELEGTAGAETGTRALELVGFCATLTAFLLAAVWL